MTTPTYDEYKLGSTVWHHEHEGITYTLNHHGYSRGNEYKFSEYHPGIWCYYLLIPEQMFPHRWKDFAVVRNEHGYTNPGPAFLHEMFNSEITWSSSEPYWDRKNKRMWDGAKVGCDYNHLWHHERGYPDSYSSVKFDAEQTVKAFIKANPDRLLRCSYGSKWGKPEDFYIAVNGCRVHKEQEIPPTAITWLPKVSDEIPS